MVDRNCPNCGEQISGDKKTCPYCGARFVDATSINLKDFEPFYLTFRCGDHFEETGKVRVSMWSLASSADKPLSMNLLIESAEDDNDNDSFVETICSTQENNRAKKRTFE